MPSTYGFRPAEERVIPSPVILLIFLAATGLIATTRTAAQSPAAAFQPQGSDQVAKSHAIMRLTGLPLGFEPNRGQMDPAVKYAARGGHYTLFLTSSKAVFALPEHLELPSNVKDVTAKTAARQTSKPSIWASLTMQLVGARPIPDFSASDQLPGKKNYYVGRDKANWAAGVPLYSRVQSHDVYPGIDIAFRGVKQELEFDFLVSPGANPRRIKLAFAGARHIKIDSSGDLVVSSAGGDLQVHRPLAYQDMPDGKRKLVDARFAKRGNGEIQLALGSYDPRRQLVIDPSVTYATYLGGTLQDAGLGVDSDGKGNTIVTGATASPKFPNTIGEFPYAGGLDVFVTELDASGQLVFSTLVGGSGDDVGTAIAIGTSSNQSGIYVTGYTTSADFPAIGLLYGAY
jgi:hypothetical protein